MLCHSAWVEVMSKVMKELLSLQATTADFFIVHYKKQHPT